MVACVSCRAASLWRASRAQDRCTASRAAAKKRVQNSRLARYSGPRPGSGLVSICPPCLHGQAGTGYAAATSVPRIRRPPIWRSDPKKAMTIAVALWASNGLVVAADSQMTAGQWKSVHGKISDASHSWEGSNGACVITAAGWGSSLRLLHKEGLEVFQADVTRSGEDLRAAFQVMLQRFHMDHVLPFAAFPQDQRPEVYMLFAGQRNGRKFLWRSERAEITEEESYAAVGSGSQLAELLLAPFYNTVPFPNVRSAVLLASYVVGKVKEFDTFCGKHTDIQVVAGNRAIRLPRSLTREMEVVMAEYDETFAAPTLRRSIGIDAGDPADAKAAFDSRVQDVLTRLGVLLTTVTP
jgi:ATP-dependent protease HslVU (ClpYQ) peptidase subunit